MKENEFIKETQEHIKNVGIYMDRIMGGLVGRRMSHDESKMQSPEKEIFIKYTPKLKNSTYNSEEYKQFLKEMKPALDHHYKVNDHHPEWFEKGISGMDLVNLIEMICDWKAATLRHKDGDIKRSIEQNQKRFGYSDELKQILLNTLKYFG